MKESEFTFPSQDGNSMIRALLWEPDAPENAQGIVQILHGMAEHIERYRGFASFLTSKGFIVCGHDHIGHGKSVASPNQYGVMPAEGMTILIEDGHELRQLAHKRYPELLPYVMFGHSMGSFVLRSYLALHAEGLAAAIVCGPGHVSASLSGAGLFFARILNAVRGLEHRSDFLHGLSVGSYSKVIENARTPLDWLSTDETVVDAYDVDEACGFKFASGANIALLSLTGNIVKRSTVEAVPTELPLLFIAGDKDPVGENGVGVKKAVALFEETGHEDVTLILYEGMRHEILNEVGKEQVYDDVYAWLQAHLGSPVAV